MYANDIWGLDDIYIEIRKLRTFLEGHRELFVDTFKEIF